jgi:hypothetical protein
MHRHTGEKTGKLVLGTMRPLRERDLRQPRCERDAVRASDCLSLNLTVAKDRNGLKQAIHANASASGQAIEMSPPERKMDQMPVAALACQCIDGD